MAHSPHTLCLCSMVLCPAMHITVIMTMPLPHLAAAVRCRLCCSQCSPAVAALLGRDSASLGVTPASRRCCWCCQGCMRRCGCCCRSRELKASSIPLAEAPMCAVSNGSPSGTCTRISPVGNSTAAPLKTAIASAKVLLCNIKRSLQPLHRHSESEQVLNLAGNGAPHGSCAGWQCIVHRSLPTCTGLFFKAQLRGG